MDDPYRILLQFGVILVLVLFNAFFAAAEIALVSVRKTRIKQLVEEGDHRAALAGEWAVNKAARLVIGFPTQQ